MHLLYILHAVGRTRDLGHNLLGLAPVLLGDGVVTEELVSADLPGLGGMTSVSRGSETQTDEGHVHNELGPAALDEEQRVQDEVQDESNLEVGGQHGEGLVETLDNLVDLLAEGRVSAANSRKNVAASISQGVEEREDGQGKQGQGLSLGEQPEQSDDGVLEVVVVDEDLGGGDLQTVLLEKDDTEAHELSEDAHAVEVLAGPEVRDDSKHSAEHNDSVGNKPAELVGLSKRLQVGLGVGSTRSRLGASRLGGRGGRRSTGGGGVHLAGSRTSSGTSSLSSVGRDLRSHLSCIVYYFSQLETSKDIKIGKDGSKREGFCLNQLAAVAGQGLTHP